MTEFPNRPMKVLMVGASFQGGAGRASQRLYRALSSEQNSSFSLSGLVGRERDPATRPQLGGCEFFDLPFARKLVVEKLAWLVRVLGTQNKNRVYSSALVSTGLLQRINAAKPDVVNLHWLGDRTLSIREISKIDAPIVWTLHDEWLFRGA